MLPERVTPHPSLFVSDKISQLHAALQAGDMRALARGITLVESGLADGAVLLHLLRRTASTRVVGITGPPGAGKSTLVAGLLRHWTGAGMRVGVVAVDPSSPFHFGALLGDRIRMAEFYTHPQVFIRSLASRGALGGLHPHIIEVTDVMKEAGFDVVLVETVGVGQSEVEIAGLADCTVVALVPEAGDTVQTMKAGLLEIADIFVVNKADRDGADAMLRALKILAHEQGSTGQETPVIATSATTGAGVEELSAAILRSLENAGRNETRCLRLLTEKTIQLIRLSRMQDVHRASVEAALMEVINEPSFNLYSFAESLAHSGSALPAS